MVTGKGHSIPFPVRNEGLAGVEGVLGKIENVHLPDRNLDPKIHLVKNERRPGSHPWLMFVEP